MLQRRSTLIESPLFTHDTPVASTEERGYCFVYGSPTSETRMLKLCDDLRRKNVTVETVGESRFCRCSGASVDHGYVTAKLREAKEIIVCLDQEVLDRVQAFNFGDFLVTAFTVTKTLDSRRIIVVVTDRSLVDPASWGWNPLYARFASLEVVDVSMDTDSESWKGTVEHLAGWCVDHDSRVQHAEQAPEGEKPFDWRQTSPESPRSRATKTAGVEGQGVFRSPWLAGKKRARGRRYDVYLTHNWGEDSQGRDNHVRVMRIAASLRLHGLRVFFDDWEMHRYRNIDEAMVRGMRYASVVCVVLTKRYIDKVSKGEVFDNCVAEFNLAKKVPGVVVAIMEEDLRNPAHWGYGSIFGQLSSRLYVDLSAADGHMIHMVGCNRRARNVQRWHCALDGLEMRIRTETAMIEGIRERHLPPPWVPHRDMVVFMSVMFCVAALIDMVIVVLSIVHDTEKYLKIASWTCWTIGFIAHACVEFMHCRKPPHFMIHYAEIQFGVVGSSGIRVLAGLIGLASACTQIRSITLVAFAVLLAGNVLGLMAASFMSRNTDSGFDYRAPLTFHNLPHWGSVSLAASSGITICALLSEEPLAVRFNVAAAALMMATSMLYYGWAAFANRALANYFKSASFRNNRELADQELPDEA